jgi:hypothetical protein
MLGDVPDGHVAREFQRVPLKALGVAAPRVGEADLDLADGATGPAFDARDGQDRGRGPTADGHETEASFDRASRLDVSRATGRTAAGLGFLVDGEDGLAALIVGAPVVVAADAECVIQQAGGHADLPLWSPFTQLQVESACPPFSTPGARFSRMNRK